jgi:hypothetical protein
MSVSNLLVENNLQVFAKDVKVEEKAVIPAKTTAERTALTPENGEIVLDSDQGKFYAGNGTAWLDIGGGGAGPSGDVVGPASSENSTIATYVGTSGKTLGTNTVTLSSGLNIMNRMTNQHPSAGLYRVFPPLPNGKTTLTSDEMFATTGESVLFHQGAGLTMQIPTVANLIAHLESVGYIMIDGFGFEFKIINSSGSSNSVSLTTNTGWSVVDSKPVAVNSSRTFFVVIDNTVAETATLYSLS